MFIEEPTVLELTGTQMRSRRFPGPRLRPRLGRSERGQALAEFAMILPVFFLLLFSLVDFGRAFYTWLVLTNGAREGARVGAVQGDAAAITARVNESTSTLQPTALTTTLTNVRGARGTTVTVALRYNFQYVTPIGAIAGMLGSTLRTPVITASSSMRLE